MTTTRRSEESRIGLVLTWLATFAGILVMVGFLFLGSAAAQTAMDGVQTSGLFSCRDEACVQRSWLTAGLSVAYAAVIIVLIFVAHWGTRRTLWLSVAIGLPIAAALAVFGILIIPGDDVGGAGALVLAAVPALLALGSLLRVRARPADEPSVG